MTNRFDTPKAPLRADTRPKAATPPMQSMRATGGGLIRSTLLAAGAAGVILVLFWLPAEYGIDPTGVGALTGLTEMGEIKQQLSAEAEADAQAVPVLATGTGLAEILSRLDQIDAQLAGITAVIGAPNSQAAPMTTAPSVAKTDLTLENTAIAPEWRDEVSYTLNPGQGIEVKLVMQEGQVALFHWTANGGVVNYDTHGDGGGQSISYEQGRAVAEQTGDLMAAFTGNHGWFWRNRTDAPVTVTLRTAGDYATMNAP